MEPARKNIDQALQSEDAVELVVDLESVDSANSNAIYPQKKVSGTALW